MRRLSQKIASEISFLQEEHRIFKRPFIVGGIDLQEVLRRYLSPTPSSPFEPRVEIGVGVSSFLEETEITHLYLNETTEEQVSP